MVKTIHPDTTLSSQEVLEQCVEFARRNGVGPFQGSFQAERRASPRWLFVSPVRYCLGSGAAPESYDFPGYTLNISLDGMALWCLEALPAGATIWVRLSMPDGREAWVQGKVIYCEPDAEHYQAGIEFAVHRLPLESAKKALSANKGQDRREKN